jgi:hypothetical protein
MKAIVSTLISTLLVFGLIAALPAEASGEEKQIFTKHFNESLFDITRNAAFSVEVILDEKEYEIGKDVIGIVIHGKGDLDVAGAELTITRTDLETGETIPGEITITDRGNGLYIVSGVDPEREGRWELSVGVEKDGAEGSVGFTFPEVLEKRYHKGRYSP